MYLYLVLAWLYAVFGVVLNAVKLVSLLKQNMQTTERVIYMTLLVGVKRTCIHLCFFCRLILAPGEAS